ncbi:hypothetical protein PTSG_10799 [Salpingoeca rosetta]|uniref:Cytochrome P450 n=1 Tax=Salpingoeca rosetta (strain ATCC 50818 / BSB-021) TaxID=946362 RepID=F2UPY6_SALR5|nr:uncharacterized protein PTSG_10799 [Salpingoeca rosetta]EGD79816.1 hypothetical protein PTSG_10799 [Salpingoeca rosetta]|eukprot:XP_004988764.1 hypothetical protein PTSG_10799 [Salpingoeca rosetta]
MITGGVVGEQLWQRVVGSGAGGDDGGDYGKVKLVLLTVVAVLVVRFLAAFWSWWKFRSVLKRFTGAELLFPSGTAREHSDYESWFAYTDKYAKIEPLKPVRYCFGIFVNTVAVRRPADIKAIITSNPPKGAMIRKLLGWLGRTSVLLTEGEEWRSMRTLLNPAFHRTLLKDYTQTMLMTTDELVHKFETFAERPEEPVEISSHFVLLALDTVCRCAFSYESGCQNTADEPFTKTISSLAEEVLRRLGNPVYMIDWVYALTSHGRELNRKTAFINDHARKIIEKRRDELQGMSLEDIARGKRPSGRALFDFLDICLLSRDKDGNPALTTEELEAQCTTFLGAGFDTTATALTFITYLFAKHPQEQQKCREEIFEALGASDAPSFDDFAKLPYTMACIKEAMRLIPPVPVVSRVLEKPLTLECGETLPKGTFVDMNIYMLHHNPTVWNDPETFRPERFLNKRVDQYSYMPFSLGPRNCIGSNFAMNEIKHEPRMGSAITLRSMNGVKVKIQVGPCTSCVLTMKEHPNNAASLKYILKYSRENRGGAIRFWHTVLMPHVVVYQPADVKKVITRNSPKTQMLYRFVRPWLGQKSLLLLEGEEWRTMRHLLNPAFHRVLLKNYSTVIVEATEELVTKFNRYAATPDKEVDVFPDFCLLTLDAICRCAFGYESGCQTNPKEKYATAIGEIANFITKRVRTPKYLFDTIYERSDEGREFQAVLDYVHGKANEIIARRKEELKGVSIEDVARDKRPSGRALFDFLDICLLSRDKDGNPALTDEEIRSQCDTFLFAGHDTTSTALSWLTYNLSKHPEYQERCRQEIIEAFGDEHPDFDRINELKFTTACIKESMRLYPPVLGTGRVLDQPLELQCGVVLQPGTSVGCSSFASHRNPDTWEDPDTYNPERFLETRPDIYAYFPFSVGSRNCIGNNFAMNEIRVVMCQLLRKFKFLPVDYEPLLESVLVLRSQNGVKVRIQKLHEDN